MELVQSGERLELHDPSGRVVGRMAKAYTLPIGSHCVEARVAAVIVRRREDSDADYREAMRCDQWEVVVPEFVFESE